MLRLVDIRQYISDFKITGDTQVYIGKLDNKKQKSIGVYNRKTEGSLIIPLGGLERSSYETKAVSLLVHWNKSVTESEKAAYQLFKELLNENSPTIGGKWVHFIKLQTPHPVDVGTDDNGVYEYVIWADFIYERKE